VRLVVLSLLCVVTLSSCGIKGPLYLPDDAAPKPPVVQTSGQPGTAPAAKPATPSTPSSK